MSNYHVEPIDQPQALTKEAIKSLRSHQVQGLSRRQLMRGAIGAGVGLWMTEVLAGTIAFVWPNLLPLEKDLVKKNEFRIVFHEMDWRLNDLTGGRPE